MKTLSNDTMIPPAVKKLCFLNLFFLHSLVSQGNGLNVETRFSYNENDAIEERISSDGVVTIYTYDSVDRLTEITYSNGEAGTQFAYNYLDQIDYIIDSTGTSDFSYIDNFHKVEQVAYSHGHDVNVYYNEIGDLYYVQANNLNGEISPEIENLECLTVLRIGNNKIKGEIPVELTNLTCLNIAASLNKNTL